jgi:hypothetical protein
MLDLFMLLLVLLLLVLLLLLLVLPAMLRNIRLRVRSTAETSSC